MSEEEYKEIRITRDDLINWIDRPPSNEDIELCDYLVNALDNQFKYYNIIEEVREYINHEWFKRGQLGIIDKSFQEWQLKDILQILDKVKGE